VSGAWSLSRASRLRPIRRGRANLFTLASDMFPRRAVASAMGRGTSGGALLMAFIPTLVGYVLTLTNGNYAPLFAVFGSGYLTALLVHFSHRI
jgi:ACS family hexuronate transporter-like MFS transporter